MAKSENQKDKSGIVLNRMYAGKYLSANIGHEVINLLNAKNGQHYLYLNATGDFDGKYANKINNMLLVKYAGQAKDGHRWVEVLGLATGLHDVYNKERHKQNEDYVVHDKVEVKDIKYINGNKEASISDIFKGSEQQDVLITYVANKLYKPKSKTFLRFGAYNGQQKTGVLKYIIDNKSIFTDNDNKIYKGTIWQQLKDGKQSKLDDNEIVVVDIQSCKFGSTSLKRYFLESSEGHEVLSKLVNDNNYWEEWTNDTDPITLSPRKSIFKICQIEDNENCFSNALAHFIDVYPEMWLMWLKKVCNINKEYKLKEVKREVPAKYKENGQEKGSGRIDLEVIVSDSKRNEHAYIIENKLKSDINGIKGDDETGQLRRYKDYADNTYKNRHSLIVLCPEYNKPNIPEEWTTVSYRTLYDFISQYIESHDEMEQNDCFMDFFHAMQKHTYANLSDYLYAEMKSRLNERIDKVGTEIEG